jgi:hypothetical protein
LAAYLAYFETETKALGLRLNRKPQQGKPLSKHGAIVAEVDFGDDFFVGGIASAFIVSYNIVFNRFLFCDHVTK